MDVASLLAEGLSYDRIAAKLGMSKSNVAKIATQIRFEAADGLGALSAEEIRERYLDRFEDIGVIASCVGVSVIQLRRFLQAKGFHRDCGAIYRAGVKPKPRKGERVPGSRRDPASKARKGSPEHREKQAAAKRGKRGSETNNWKGGHEIGGYVGASGGSEKTYAHRMVAESLLGRKLSSQEHVHHIDRNRKNNEPHNLLVLNASIHTKLHVAMRKYILSPEDQRVWLRNNGHQFEDMRNYA